MKVLLVLILFLIGAYLIPFVPILYRLPIAASYGVAVGIIIHHLFIKK